MEKGPAEYVLRSIEELSQLQKPRTIGVHRKETAGNSFLPIIGPVKGKLLESLVKKHKPRLILEIGTLVGYSAILMAQHLKNGKILSLEIDESAADIAKENIRKAGLSGKT